MKKLLFLLVLINLGFFAQSQVIKISQMNPAGSVDGSTFLAPVVTPGGLNFKIAGKFLSYDKEDSTWKSHDSLFYRRFGLPFFGGAWQSQLSTPKSIQIVNNSISLLNDSTITTGNYYFGYSAGRPGFYLNNLGTVSSISMTVPNWVSVSPSTITNSGTFAITGATGVTANQVVQSNGSGNVVLAALTANHIPSLDASKITTGTFNNSLYGTSTIPISAISATGTPSSSTFLNGAGAWSNAVTTVSVGNLSPIFTGSVSNASTTPAISFTLSTAAQWTILGNNSGISAAPVYFAPSLTSALFANQGSTTTLLHGNGAGNPTFSQVNLATDITGNLPVGNLNGGTGASSSTFLRGDMTWATPAGAGTVTNFSAGNANPIFTTSVATASSTPALSFTISTAAQWTVLGNNTGSSATPTYFSPTLASALFNNQGTTTTVLHGNASGNPAWSQVSLSADITGTLGLGNGGTGQTTANAALNALLPTQTSNSGKFLTTDGSNTSWATAAGGGSPTIKQNGTTVASQPNINFIDGNNISASHILNNTGATQIDATFNQKYDWNWNFLFKLNVGGVGGIFYQNADGGANSSYTPVVGGKPGGFVGFVGTGTTGRIAFGTADPSMWFDSSNSVTTRLRLENVRWDGANINNAYELEMGFINGYGSANTKATNGCYFLYSDTLNSGKWIIECATNGVYTTTNTTTSIDNTVAHNYEVIYKKFSVDFQIDGSSIGIINSGNIPNGNTRTFGAGMNMFKQSGTSDNAFQCEGWRMSWHVE